MARRPRRRQYGLGSIDQVGPENFRVRWYDPETGKQLSKRGFRTRTEAEEGVRIISEESRRLATGQGTRPEHVPPLSYWVDAWLIERRGVLRAQPDDQYRWKNHLKPVFGSMLPAQVEAEHVEAFIRSKRGEADPLAPETIGHCVRLLSRIFTSLVAKSKRTGVKANPVRSLTRDVRRLYKSDHDPRNTPYVERQADIARIVGKLPQPFSTMYAVGAYTGMRPGEVHALSWPDVSLKRRNIRVWRAVGRDGSLGPLKDDETRFVPILDPLLPILTAWQATSGGIGFLFPSPRQRAKTKHKSDAPSFVRGSTYIEALRTALLALNLPSRTVYQATRHTFASQWVMADGSIAKLADILGHATTWVTERYAHLQPGRFSDSDLSRLGGAIESKWSPVGVQQGGESGAK